MPDISCECVWDILHNGHHAWFQRRLMAIDFKPGSPLESTLAPSLADSVVTEDGRSGDRFTPPTCATCADDPDAPALRVEDLEPVDRATGARGFLEERRSGRKPWPAARDPRACWFCNAPASSPTGDDGLCPGCRAYLSGGN